MGSPSASYDVFLSHNSEDKPAVETLAKRLRDNGLLPFLDKWHLIPGMQWQLELARALDNSQCVAIFFGRSGEGTWHNQEMQVALNKAARTRDDYRVIPVLLPGADPSQVDGFLELRTWVDFRVGLDDDVSFRRLVAAIQGVAPESDDGLAELPDEPRPYRGLERFDEASHQFFFGRNPDIKELCERLESDRLVTVVGASGSGKSSLVLAGLHTEHAQRLTPGIDKWQRIVMRPGNDPLREMAVALVAHLPVADRPALIRTFREDFLSDRYEGLTTALSTLFPNKSQATLIVVDQLEEIFTHRPTSEEQQEAWKQRIAAFMGNLRSTFEAHGSWLRIIVTLRGDFVDQCIAFPDLCELIERRQFWLGEMDEDDLREAVVEPARKRGAFFEKGLVEMILRDMRGQGGALPLLEEALDALWNGRRGPWLTIDVYQQLGGVGGALVNKADAVYNSLIAADRAIARRVFLGLIQLGEGTRDTRRRSPIPSLISATDDPQRVQAIIDRFAASRLISLSSDDAKVDTAEVTHEALIDNWQELHAWLDESRDDLRFHRRVAEAAQNWNDSDRPEGSLWRPPDLDLLRTYALHASASLTQLQLDFFTESDRTEEARIVERIRHQKILRNRMRIAVGTALASLVLLALAAWQWQKADGLATDKVEIAASLEFTNTELERTNSTLTSTNAELNLKKFELEGANSELTAQTLRAQRFQRTGDLATLGALNLDSAPTTEEAEVGALLVLEALDREPESLQAQLACARVLEYFPPPVITIDIPRIMTTSHEVTLCDVNVDGRFLALSDENNRLYVLNIEADKVVQTSPDVSQSVTAIAFAPYGSLLMVGNGDGEVHVLSVEDGQKVESISLGEPVQSFGFLSHGRDFAAAGLGGTIKIWRIGSWQEKAAFEDRAGDAMSIQFSPDGQWFATRSYHSQIEENVVRIRDFASGEPLCPYVQGDPHSFVLSRDGRYLVLNGDDWGDGPSNKLTLFELRVRVEDGGMEYQRVQRYSVSIRGAALAFDTLGHRLVAAADEMFRLFATRGGREIGRIDQQGVKKVVFVRDGNALAAAGRGRLQIWDFGVGQQLAQDLTINNAPFLDEDYENEVQVHLAGVRERIGRSLTPEECAKYYLDDPTVTSGL